MANPIKEILLGIREELAFERSQPYKATLVATEARGQFNTQLRDQLEGKFKKSSEAGPGVMLSTPTSEPVIPYESLNDRFERVAKEIKGRLNKEGEPPKNAVEIFESFPPLENKSGTNEDKTTEPIISDIEVRRELTSEELKQKILRMKAGDERLLVAYQRQQDPEERKKIIDKLDDSNKAIARITDRYFLTRYDELAVAHPNKFSNSNPDPTWLSLELQRVQSGNNPDPTELEFFKWATSRAQKNLVMKEPSPIKKPDIKPGVQDKKPVDLEFKTRDVRISEFFGKHQRGELGMEQYDEYRELVEAQIKVLEEQLRNTQNPDEQAAVKLQISRRSGEYINITSHQVDMLVKDLRSGKIDRKSMRNQFSRIKDNFEANKAGMPPYEIEASKIYLEKVGAELDIKQDIINPVSSVNELTDKGNQEKDYLRWLSVLKKSDSWESFQSSLRDIGYIEVGDKKVSPESVWKRVLRLQKEYADAKDANKINAPLVQEALRAVPSELRRTVTRLLEIKTDEPVTSEPIQKDIPKLEGDPVAESINNAETWEDLDKAIRGAGEIKSAGIEYTANEVLGQITDLRDALKMANGNFDTATFKSALEVLTGAHGIRAKVLELLDRENEEKYFRAGDRVVFEGKKWDIVRVENGKAVIQTLSEDKKAMPDRIVPLTDLVLEVKPIESQVPLEEDFKKPVEATIAGGPETTAIPEEVPQWKKDFQAQVNKSFEAYRSRFYRKYRDEAEVYAEYQRKVNRGWVGWLKDRYASFSTFGITDFHAAEKFKTATGEAGAQIEFVADALAREGTEANDAYIRGIVDQTLGRLVKQFEGKRASNGRPVLTDEKLKSLEDRLIIELRATQQEKIMRNRGELTKILREGLDKKWWKQYVYGAAGTLLASINLSYLAMPAIEKWIFGSGVVAAPTGAAEGTAKSLLKNVAPNAIDSVKNMPSAWNLAAGENPWSVSEKLLRAAGKAVNPDTIKLVDAALCRENGIGVPEWAIPGTVNHGAVAVGTTLKIANALRVIASMP